MNRFLLVILLTALNLSLLKAQENYEIQVYGSETIEQHHTMFELHTNVTTMGFKKEQNGVVADDLAWHETVEITHGFTSWFELGTYLFLSANKDQYGLTYVGNHIRPRFRAPDSWHWPVGVSLSLEVGYQRRRYAEDIWTLELRPIIDKQISWFYVAFNPVVDYSFVGSNHNSGPEFSPNVKVKFDVTRKVGIGLEYYGGIGPFKSPDRPSQQFHQLGLAVDLDVHPDWEINFGYMFGLTSSTEQGIAKVIIGRRIDWTRKTDKKRPSL